MTLYEQLLTDLNTYAVPSYASFHKKLLGEGEFKVIGVNVPTLRKLAKKYYSRLDEVLTFPDEYYEVKFIKLACAAMLPYGKFTAVVEGLVATIDNWGLCDCFSAKCIKGNEVDFLNYIQKFIKNGGEFYQRYALTTLLSFYIKPEYLSLIFSVVLQVDTSLYYVHMAAAWLLAEVLVKYYGEGVEFLSEGKLDKATHNKCIQKACESFRIAENRKNYLKGIKR